jgi:hypothetical protein
MEWAAEPEEEGVDTKTLKKIGSPDRNGAIPKYLRLL